MTCQSSSDRKIIQFANQARIEDVLQARERALVLGVTGGIACGKSLVADLFRKEGATVLSADELAREAVQRGSSTLQLIVERFGPELLTPEGELDRPALARRIFGDPAGRAELNRLTHPVIGAMAEERIQHFLQQQDPAPLLIYEAPLLFEAQAEARVNLVLVVAVDEAVQLQRLMRRDNLGHAEALQRIRAQMSLAEKKARADIILDNSGSLETTAAAVRSLYRKLSHQ